MALLEIAANSVASAFAAQEGGAGRVELCACLEEGGITPSHGTIALAREGLSIPLYVLIRPRAGDFLYENAEIEAMLDDIAHCRDLGCEGVVVGALTDHYGGRVMFPIISAVTIVPILFLAFVAIDSYTLILVGGFFLGIAGTAFAVGVPFVNAWFPPNAGGLPSASSGPAWAAPRSAR